MSRRALAHVLADGAARLVAAHVLAVGAEVDELELRTAVLALDGVVGHQDAARLHGIELLEPCGGPHVVVARDRSRARHPGAVVHRADLGANEVEECAGVRVTVVTRTLLDLSRSLPLVEAVVALDSALRQERVTLEELETALAGLPRAPGRRRVREALALADPASGSVLESVCRVLLVGAGLAPARTQYRVVAGGRLLGRVDFAWPDARLIVEVDGFAFHADRERYRSDRRRTNALVLAGWRVLRFSWEDVRHHPERVVAEVRAALAPAG